MFFNDRSGAVHPQANWNNLTGLSGTSTVILDDLGHPTGVTLSWIGSANTSYGDGSTDADTSIAAGRMFKGLVEIRQDEARRPSLTAANVPYSQYDIYVYFDLRGSDVKDTMPQRFTCTPTSGTAPPDRYGRNSLLAMDGVGDYPTYDAWVGFKESTAATVTAPNEQMLGNYVVFRGIRSSGFTVTAERQIPGNQQRLGFNAVQIVRADPDGPGVDIRPTGTGTTVTEGGAADSYTIALDYPPTAPVTISTDGGTQVSVAPSLVTFTPANWNTPQVVSVTAIDDLLPEGLGNAVIAHTLSSSGNYAGLAVSPLAVTVEDNDLPLITVSAGASPAEAAQPVEGFVQIARSGIASLVDPLTLAFQITGTATAAVDYQLDAAGLAFNPATGAGSITLPAGQSQASLRFTPINDLLKEGAETITLVLTPGAGFTLADPPSATLRLDDDDTTDYLTEWFENAAAFDLNGRSVTFTPSGGSYTASTSTISEFPSGTSGYTAFNESAMSSGSADDGWWNHTLATPFSYFGVSHTTAYVGTNGHITFASGQSSSSLAPAMHFTAGFPRITGIGRDLNPGAGGSVNVRRDTTAGQQRTSFYWNAVRNYGQTSTVNFQIDLFDDGRIRMSWLATSTAGSVSVGLASGVTATMPSPPYDGTGEKPFYESDLSAYGSAVANQPPAFSNLPPRFTTAGQPFVWTVVAIDSESQPITLTAPQRPAWLSFNDGGAGSGSLTGTPPAPGTHAVTIEAYDGATTTTLSFPLMVIPAAGNTAPSFTSNPPIQISAGSVYQYSVATSDAEGHQRTIQSSRIPGWLTLADAGDGTAMLTGTAPDTAVSEHAVTLVVSDGIHSSSQSFVIVLNQAPRVTLTSPASAFVELSDGSLGLGLEAEADDDGLPAGSTLLANWTVVSSTGPVAITDPTSLVTEAKFSSPGWHVLRLVVSDGSASAATDVNVFVETNGDAVATTGLAGWWRFDEGSGSTVADASGNNRPLTLTAATMNADGVSGKAYTGDATTTQSAEITTLAIPAQMTLAGWLWASASPATADRQVFNFHASNNSRLRLFMANSTSRLRFFSDRSTDGLWEIQFPVPAQQWFHVTVSYDSSSPAKDPVCYINGVAIPVTEIGAVPLGSQVSATSFRVGGNNSSTSAWAGRIDEAQVYQRIVPASEVPLLARTAPINSAPLVHAGPDGDTAVSVPFVLAGSASDDGGPAALITVWSRLSGAGTASFGDTALPGTAVAFDAPAIHLLRLTADDGDVRVFDETEVASVSGGLTYQAWAASRPGLGPLTGANDDPDGDGLANLAEYGLGSDPAVSSAGPAVSLITLGGERYLQIAWTRPSNRTDLATIGEAASDPALWTSSSALVSTTITPAEAGMETVVIRLLEPVGAGNIRFLRAKMTLAP
jgi:hypothetical protein